MKIQVYGAGIAGTFLFTLLSKDFEVYIKDVKSKPDCRCAWGSVYREAKNLYRTAGIDFDEYVLVKPENVVINGVWFRNVGIVTFDRRRLLEDFWSQIDFTEVKADLTVDATGYERTFLPKVRGDELYSTIQFLERHKVEENLFIQARRTGYAWAFPLGDHLWHAGSGEKNPARTSELLRTLRKNYGFNKKPRVCGCRGKIRLLPPSRCRPFPAGRVVGVGEAIGCVSGFGEGNVPALQSAKILYECLKEDRLNEYEGRIIEEFKWIENEHQLVKRLQAGKKLPTLHLIFKVISVEAKRTVKPSPESLKHLIGYLIGLK